MVKNVRELKKRSLQYFKDHEGSRFPPSYYLRQDSTCEWADRIDYNLEDCQSHKILVGYDPTIHAQLFGKEKHKICNLPEVSFDNLVIVINPKSRWVMVSAVTDDIVPASIELELRKIDAVLNTLLLTNLNLNIEYIAVVGVLVCPNINSYEDLQQHQTAIRSVPNLKMVCVTKEEWDSETLLRGWIQTITGYIESKLKQNRPEEIQSVEPLEILAGVAMASMAQTSLYLPRMTHDISTKINTVLLSQRQIEAVQDPSKWKILEAPFGGGKTVVLAEIAKNLLKVNDFRNIQKLLIYTSLIFFKGCYLLDKRFRKSFIDKIAGQIMGMLNIRCLMKMKTYYCCNRIDFSFDLNWFNN